MNSGMVVGPQQHWLHINQHHFRTWTHLGLNPSPKKRVSGTSRNISFSTPQRNPLTSIENTPTHDTPLPAPTPGQPRKIRDRVESTEHKDPLISVVTETTADGTKVTVNVTTPEHNDKDGSRGKRAASFATLGKSPSGGGRRVMSRNAENISPHHARQSESARTVSGRVANAKRVGSSGSVTSVKEGRIRKTSGSKERVTSVGGGHRKVYE
jgi:cell division cycle 14